jgi:hypothetical protein
MSQFGRVNVRCRKNCQGIPNAFREGRNARDAEKRLGLAVDLRPLDLRWDGPKQDLDFIG